MQPTASSHWLERIVSLLRGLAERPGSLLCVLLLLNTLALPYAGLTRDGMLYSGQVLNYVENGYLNNDFFFRYGSQDRFSAFSPVMAPLVAHLGITTAFLIGYLVTKTLLLYGIQRLTIRLAPEPAVAVASLFVIAMSFVPFGSFFFLVVNESVMTPRLASCGLALVAIDAVLAGRIVFPVLFLAGGFAFHPIMTLPAATVCALVFVWEHISTRAAIVLATVGLTGYAAVLAVPDLGYRAFGRMDEQWLMETIRFDGIMITPQQWPADSWPRVVAAFFVCAAAAAWMLSGPHRAAGRLMATITLVGAGGLLASTIANIEGYRLLVQAQTYRALWLVQLAQIPAGLWVGYDLFARSRNPGQWGFAVAAVVVLFATLGVPSFVPLELVVYGAALMIALFAIRGIGHEPHRHDWLPLTLLSTFLVGELFWGIYLAAITINLYGATPQTVLPGHVPIDEHIALQLWRVVIELQPLFTRIVVGTILVAVLVRLLGNGVRFAVASLVVALGASALFTAVPTTIFRGTGYAAHRRDIDFIANSLEEAGAKHPTIFWARERLDSLWVDLRSCSYYHPYQVAAVVFNEQMAHEAHRRVKLAGPFEMQRYREEALAPSPDMVENLARFFEVDADTPPTVADLRRLCADLGLDYLVLRMKFDKLYEATNGHVYLYDCQRIRRAAQ
jgi:hypothetical protein